VWSLESRSWLVSSASLAQPLSRDAEKTTKLNRIHSDATQTFPTHPLRPHMLSSADRMTLEDVRVQPPKETETTTLAVDQLLVVVLIRGRSLVGTSDEVDLEEGGSLRLFNEAETEEEDEEDGELDCKARISSA
jgi:hypothetical protein